MRSSRARGPQTSPPYPPSPRRRGGNQIQSRHIEVREHGRRPTPNVVRRDREAGSDGAGHRDCLRFADPRPAPTVLRVERSERIAAADKLDPHRSVGHVDGHRSRRSAEAGPPLEHHAIARRAVHGRERALCPFPARTMSPPFAQMCVSSIESTRADIVTSPSAARCANWNSSSDPQIFAPAPCTIQRPFSTRAPPRTVGKPMSSLFQPPGSALGAGGGGCWGFGCCGVGCGCGWGRGVSGRGVCDGPPTRSTVTDWTKNSPPMLCTRMVWMPLVRRTTSLNGCPLAPSVCGSPSTNSSPRPPGEVAGAHAIVARARHHDVPAHPFALPNVPGVVASFRDIRRPNRHGERSGDDYARGTFARQAAYPRLDTADEWITVRADCVVHVPLVVGAEDIHLAAGTVEDVDGGGHRVGRASVAILGPALQRHRLVVATERPAAFVGDDLEPVRQGILGLCIELGLVVVARHLAGRLPAARQPRREDRVGAGDAHVVDDRGLMAASAANDLERVPARAGDVHRYGAVHSEPVRVLAIPVPADKCPAFGVRFFPFGVTRWSSK